MNEKQIIQALETCKKYVNCKGCPYLLSAKCITGLMCDALSLIERQREEINELTGKHYNECGQIARYSDELQQLTGGENNE